MSVWSDLKKNPENLPKTDAKNFYDVPTAEDRLQSARTNALPVTIVENKMPPGTITLDLETGSVDDMWSTGPGFIRLSGHTINDGHVFNVPSPGILINDIKAMTGKVIGHNHLNFDLILLDKHYGLSILELARTDRIIDTKLCCFLADPPYSRTSSGEIEKLFSLESVGTKYLGHGKMVDVVSGKSVLKKLAAEFGGYDKIPVEHPEYNEYLRIDVETTRDLAKVVPINDYTMREHKVAAVCATISIQGFRVDIPLLDQRIKEGEEKRIRILTRLQEYGLPSPESTKAPQMTKIGKAAIQTAFRDLGVELPLTASGTPALGKDILFAVSEETENDEVSELCGAVMSLNGIRTIYGNIHDYLVDDRVHPAINLRQSTGRLSITKPGLTVIGKRGGKVVERAVFLPDDEDQILISCDLAQVDARAVAGLSQDLEYLKLFEPGRDLHAEMAGRLFGTVDKREEAKAAAHGINYGMRARKLALTTGMSMFDAETTIMNFENNFPRLTQWQNEMREVGELSGVLYNGFGRMMRIESERAFTQSPALMGQSTARDILMEGVLRLWTMGGEQVIRMIRGVIHDELVMSVHKNDVEEIERMVVTALSFPWCPVGGEYPVQITAGLNQRGVNWADCYRK